MDYKQLPIWRKANLLLVTIEQAVLHFPRYHKYTLGSELRQKAMRICQCIHRAVTRRSSKIKLVQQLSELIDDLKCQVQLAKELHAFKSFSQFQSVVELVVGLGKQAGGWLKQTRAELPLNKGR
ncbi:hypothetical protein DS891_10040 [Pseudoalteromonas sp. JC28]|uniref:four helix bundle protein n=1 Tax=Pseudoalteromonas sp. JC28 TaxID=2267617 RepID=UPI001572CA25|nr:four helix bundle protein [Pseudoalteromonas sp. JC28]NSY33923.1 hypothetical protein [Pseudoalteromonas sp. JC28]